MTDQKPSIDQHWEHFKHKVHDIMNEFIPTKMINNSKRKLPWINKEIKSLIRKKKQTVQENEPTQKHKNNTTI